MRWFCAKTTYPIEKNRFVPLYLFYNELPLGSESRAQLVFTLFLMFNSFKKTTVNKQGKSKKPPKKE